jgi:hypothetical protein
MESTKYLTPGGDVSMLSPCVHQPPASNVVSEEENRLLVLGTDE